MNKKIVVALSIVALLFANAPTAHAINFQDIKDFLIGPGSNSTQEVSEENVDDRSNLVGAAVLASLTSAHSVAVFPATSSEEGVGGIEPAQQSSHTATFSFAVEDGDSLWNRIEAELEASFPDMSEDQENYTIDRIVDEVRALDNAIIEEVGISSGNPDLIYPDENISFTVSVAGESNSDIEINLN